MAAIDLRLDIFNYDALSSFIWFHLVPIVRVHCIYKESYLFAGELYFIYRQLAASWRRVLPPKLSTIRGIVWRK